MAIQWTACVVGDDSYLSDLIRAQNMDGLFLERTSDGFLLRSPPALACSSEAECRELAEQWVVALNGAAEILGGLHTPVSVSYVLEESSSQPAKKIVSICDELTGLKDTVSMVVKDGDKVVEEYYPAKFAPSWIQLTDRDESVQAVLRLASTRTWSWVQLYRIFERIRADVGGERAFQARGWLSKSAMKRFTHSANHPETAGDEARHGHLNSDPPRDPMSLPEAKSLIIALVHQWVQSKLGIC